MERNDVFTESRRVCESIDNLVLLQPSGVSRDTLTDAQILIKYMVEEIIRLDEKINRIKEALEKN